MIGYRPHYHNHHCHHPILDDMWMWLSVVCAVYSLAASQDEDLKRQWQIPKKS